MPALSTAHILGMKVNSTSYAETSDLIFSWARRGESRYVCVATVNQVMEAYDSPAFRGVMNGADIVTPDGMPLVWGLRLLGHKDSTRVYGPELTPRLLERAAAEEVPVGFYGASEETLKILVQTVRRRYPSLKVSYAYSPPFRPLSVEEDQQIVAQIGKSGARLLFIGLSSPKQDMWMAVHKNSIQAVTIGVGAAFDFIAGTKRQAPRWMMLTGTEWLFRLATEPRRLWKRYLKHNPRFIFRFGVELLSRGG